ncbi:MAG: hypothetical protein H7Y14_02985 [Burkholderiales bacterium]|nr:hypothetical protein [Burkholderiales bacterium]
MSAKDDRDRAVRRKLDEVVGIEYDAPRFRGFTAWLRARWLKWTLGVAFAVGAMLLVVYTIESHRLPPSIPAPVKKPVPVEIIPPR